MNDAVLEIFSEEVSSSNIEIYQIVSSDYRLDSSHFVSESKININEDIQFEPLSKIASVFFPGIFKRILVENSKFGIGFLTTSEMMIVEPKPEKFLSIELTENLEIYRVEKNSLLVSRSGSVGNTIYVNEDLLKYAITEDALRVKPFDEKNIGLIYFFFTSEYGKNLITGQQSGAVIDHIYEENLLNLSIPVFKDETNKYFDETFKKVKSNREQANQLLTQARQLVLEYNNLPPLDEVQPETLDPEQETDLRLVSTEEFNSDFRLDAHFYNPMAKIIISNLVLSPNEIVVSRELNDSVFTPKMFARNYVNSQNGIPFLSGKNLIQIRPNGLKYISKSETNDVSNLLVHKNYILITRAGTVGRTAYVYNNYENFAVSDNVLRIVPNSERIDPGYYYAFLTTDYGFYQIDKYKHGSVIDVIDDDYLNYLLISIPNKDQQKEIGDLVRQAYDLRAEAIRLEDEAQEILNQALTGK
ncbi:MAG TPA: hypothetical protein DCP10_05720 [Bacteroidales bacterium]|nr:hypothetical protein [Bacteroidales bacterium]